MERFAGIGYHFDMSALPPPRTCERAYLASDASFDGVFVVAVRTTGIFCRPSCPARKPFPNNVEYFATADAALRAGYRPCKRCRPMDLAGSPPRWVRDLLADVERDPAARRGEADLKARGLDPAAVRRYFRKHFGMTFQTYARGRRMGAASRQLQNGAGLDGVALNHGYESLSGFREAFLKAFGQPPGRGRGADGVVTTWVESPLGPLLAGAVPEGVCLLEFTDRRALPAQLAAVGKHFGRPVVPGDSPLLEQLRKELISYFAGSLRDFTVPLTYPGTAFQQKVWGALRTIPYGQTWSYWRLAEAVGVSGAARAVGRANGQNRIAVVIPCHRVINKDGSLGGYGGGLGRKQFLLGLEGSPLFSPHGA